LYRSIMNYAPYIFKINHGLLDNLQDEGLK
jgi:hypothetical protein